MNKYGNQLKLLYSWKNNKLTQYNNDYNFKKKTNNLTS